MPQSATKHILPNWSIMGMPKGYAITWEDWNCMFENFEHSLDAPELVKIFEDESVLPSQDFTKDLCYRHILALADFHLTEALKKDTTIEMRAKLMGRAKGMMQLAWVVGEDWEVPPPVPKHLARYVAEFMLGELDRDA